MRSPSQWPGTARSRASGGRCAMLTMPARCPRRSVVRRVLRSARPVRRHLTSSRRRPATTLHVKAAVHGVVTGLVTHAHARVTRKQEHEPPADLLGAGLGMQPILHVRTQPVVEREPARLWPPGTLIGQGLSHRRPVARLAANRPAPQLSAHRRWRSTKLTCDRAHTFTCRSAAGDLLPFAQGQAPLTDDDLVGRKGSGITPPTCRNQRHATVIDTPTDAAASAITMPDRTAEQNSRWTSTGIARRPPILTQHLNRSRCCVDRLNSPGVERIGTPTPRGRRQANSESIGGSARAVTGTMAYHSSTLRGEQPAHGSANP
jgi:hypothetical protein